MPEPDGATLASPIAVLIDADNVRAEYLEPVLREAAKFGRPTIRRAYGNWTGPELQGWKERLHEHAVQPMQQFSYVSRKNATDAAMIIDAMDILHAGLVASFCLVASDSDYTRLATRLREAGKTVIGIGRSDTPQPLVRACDRFVHLENLAAGSDGKREAEARPAQGQAKPPVRTTAAPEAAAEFLRKAVADAEAEDGWANLAAAGELLYANHPDFDTRNYGKRNLALLLEALASQFEVQRPPENQPGTVRVRIRKESGRDAA